MPGRLRIMNPVAMGPYDENWRLRLLALLGIPQVLAGRMLDLDDVALLAAVRP